MYKRERGPAERQISHGPDTHTRTHTHPLDVQQLFSDEGDVSVLLSAGDQLFITLQ